MRQGSHNDKIIGTVGLVQLEKKSILLNNLLQLTDCSSGLGRSDKKGNVKSRLSPALPLDARQLCWHFGHKSSS